MRDEVFETEISQFVPPGSIDEQWDIPGLEKALDGDFGIDIPIRAWLEKDHELHESTLRERIFQRVDEHFDAKEAATGPEVMRHFEKALMLNVLDQQWKDHLGNMDYLRQGIGLRSYAQKKPTQEYKRESFEMFTELLEKLKFEVIRILARVKIRAEEDVEAVGAQRQSETPMEFRHADAGALGATPEEQGPGAVEPFVREGRKVGRNEPCPCGSGNKYKHCHGKLT
jgi:preprotein translocase subunit SecA